MWRTLFKYLTILWKRLKLTKLSKQNKTIQKLYCERALMSHKTAPGLISYSYGAIKHKRHSNVMLFCRQHGVIYFRAIHNFLLFTLCWFSSKNKYALGNDNIISTAPCIIVFGPGTCEPNIIVYVSLSIFLLYFITAVIGLKTLLVIDRWRNLYLCNLVRHLTQSYLIPN